MDSANPVEEKMVLLEFHDKVTSDLLKSQVFLRLANLEEANPLIQLNDLIFKGSYDYSLGTNLLFKEIPNDVCPEFPFDEMRSKKLQFFSTITKVLNCTQMKVDSDQTEVPANQQNIKFNFKYDYKELLKKLEDGSLNLQDLVSTEENDVHDDKKQSEDTTQEQLTEQLSEHHEEPMEIPDDTKTSEKCVTEIAENVSNEKSVDELSESYRSLLLLARTPVKRSIKEEECECDPQWKDEFDYKSIECKVLMPPLFSYLNKGDSSNSINLDRCVTLGLLSESDSLPSKNIDRSSLMTVDNFENLDLTARYSVLFSHMEALEKEIQSNTVQQNNEKDEFGRNPLKTLDILKRLLTALSRRIEEIRSVEEGNN